MDTRIYFSVKRCSRVRREITKSKEHLIIDFHPFLPLNIYQKSSVITKYKIYTPILNPSASAQHFTHHTPNPHPTTRKVHQNNSTLSWHTPESGILKPDNTWMRELLVNEGFLCQYVGYHQCCARCLEYVPSELEIARWLIDIYGLGRWDEMRCDFIAILWWWCDVVIAY